MFLDTITDSFLNAIMITGLVIVMMMIIELLNVRSAGSWLGSLEHSRFRQTLLGSILGVIPGCIGGFAAVSLYSHRIISFGALVACMICSSGDESFVMLAMFPAKALLLFGLLFLLSVPIGLLTDFFKDRFYCRRRGNIPLPPSEEPFSDSCSHTFEIHHEAEEKTAPSIFNPGSYRKLLHTSRLRILIGAALLIYAAAILSGMLEHEHEGHEVGINLLDERWMNILFGILTLFTTLFVLVADEHFIREHLWGHVIKSHCMRVFLWTFGALLFIGFLLQNADISSWIDDNVWYAILVAALVGIIPESGPHLIFVTLFATGALPFSVLLASSVSQDGHTALPLLASTKKGFISAKLINAAAAVIIGCIFQFCA